MTVVGGIHVEEKVFEPGLSIPWHRHEGSYGCLMLGGRSEEERRGNSRSRARIELDVGDCSWRPPEATHRFWTGSGPVHALTFEIPEERLEDLADGGLPGPEYRQSRSGTVLALGHRLRAEMRLGAAADSLTLESLVYDLVAEAAESFENKFCRLEPGWLRHVLDRLHDETDSRLGLDDLAADAGVHPVHLARTFRHQFGRPLGAYHRHLRLEHALRRVLETDARLADIALDAGFADQSHFTNLARRVVGLSPGRLRALSRHPATQTGQD